MALIDKPSLADRVELIVERNISNTEEKEKTIKLVKRLLNKEVREWHENVLAEILNCIYEGDAFQLGTDLASRAVVGSDTVPPAQRYILLNAMFDYVYKVCDGDLDSFFNLLKTKGYISTLPFSK